MPSSSQRLLAVGASLLALGTGALVTSTPAAAGTPGENLIASAGESLLLFNSSTPGTVTTVEVAEPDGYSLVGVATRPSTQVVYGLFLEDGETVPGAEPRRAKGIPALVGLAVATVDHTTGAVGTVVPLTRAADETDPGAPVTVSNFNDFALDFNPVADRLRIVTEEGDNLRANVGTGVTSIDGPINTQDGTRQVVGAAYTNSAPSLTPPASTQLFDILTTEDNGLLALQDPPNDGTLTVVGDDLGRGVDDQLGFEIGNNGVAYLLADTFTLGLSARPKGLPFPNLHVVDLGTGVAAPPAAFGIRALVDSLTSAPAQLPTTTTTVLTTTTTAAVSPTSAVATTRVLARTGDTETGQSFVGIGLVVAGGLVLVAAARLRSRQV